MRFFDVDDMGIRLEDYIKPWVPIRERVCAICGEMLDHAHSWEEANESLLDRGSYELLGSIPRGGGLIWTRGESTFVTKSVLEEGVGDD